MDKTRPKSVIYNQVEIGNIKFSNIEGIETWAIDNEGFEYEIISVEIMPNDKTVFFNQVESYIELKRTKLRILAKIKEIDVKKYSIKLTLDEIDLS